MEIVILILHVLAALGIIGLVLLQHGKGADVGAAFGSGASGSVFGSAGSANFLSRATAILAVVFFLTSMALTYFSSRSAPESGGVMGNRNAPVQSLPGQIPAQAPAEKQTAPATNPSAPVPPAPTGGGKVQDVPK
jgi:preprotein translocase subunit SecG